ncbi:peptidyl-tRNA hydrolase, partial [Striga asiatica]
ALAACSDNRFKELVDKATSPANIFICSRKRKESAVEILSTFLLIDFLEASFVSLNITLRCDDFVDEAAKHPSPLVPFVILDYIIKTYGISLTIHRNFRINTSSFFINHAFSFSTRQTMDFVFSTSSSPNECLRLWLSFSRISGWRVVLVETKIN